MTTDQDDLSTAEYVGAAAFFLSAGLWVLQVALKALEGFGGFARIEEFMQDHWTLWVPAAIVGLGMYLMVRDSENVPVPQPGELYPVWTWPLILLWAVCLFGPPWILLSRLLLFVLDVIGGTVLIQAYIAWDAPLRMMIGTFIIMMITLGIMERMRQHSGNAGTH